jgi:hypothetical protein
VQDFSELAVYRSAVELWAAAIGELGLEQVPVGPTSIRFTVPVHWRDVAICLECELDANGAPPTFAAELALVDARPGMVDQVARASNLSIDLLPGLDPIAASRASAQWWPGLCAWLAAPLA